MRVKTAVASRRRRKRWLRKARGYRGARSKLLRQAYVAVERAMAQAYVGRKEKKRQYRRLWTVRINAACRQQGLNYSRFIAGLKQAGVDLNRKMLADMAVNDPEGFSRLVETARAALANNAGNS